MPNSITFVPKNSSATPEHAGITVTSPADGEVITAPGGRFQFSASVANFRLGSLERTPGEAPCANEPGGILGGGQHIYLLIDNGMHQSQKLYQEDWELILPDPIPGPHVLRAYLSRSWEESLKGISEDTMFCALTIYGGTSSGSAAINRAVPLLTCNAPMDPTNSDGPYQFDRVLLDFFVMFGEIGGEYKVHAAIRDSAGALLGEQILTEWCPYCIHGLAQPPENQRESYELTLRLIDSNTDPVRQILNGTDLNTITRTFEVVRQLPSVP